MVLQLVKPDRKYLPSVYEAVAEYKFSPSKFEVGDIKKMIAATENNFADYFQNIENEAAGIGLKPNHVAQTTYWLVEDEQYIGTFGLRHALTPNLKNIGGNIAYQIRPSQYRKGYAGKGLKLCLIEARKMRIDKILVTCNAENVASYGVMTKVMRECGGYEDSVYKTDNLTERRVWIKTNMEK